MPSRGTKMPREGIFADFEKSTRGRKAKMNHFGPVTLYIIISIPKFYFETAREFFWRIGGN